MTSEAASSDAGQWEQWVGRTTTIEGDVALDPVTHLFATLDIERTAKVGDPVPPGFHWLYFNGFEPRSNLGQDGHPRRGGFLPPVTLPRRMWAGGSIRYEAPLSIGAHARRRSEITSVRPKSGRSGHLVFVTVRHTTVAGGIVCIVEDQDIVYREPSVYAAPPPPEALDHPPARTSEHTTDEPMLFRYSALTSNAHRIHYDRPYATAEEGYPELVVHGPLTATLLQLFATDCVPGRTLTSFSFRGTSPAFVRETLTLEARPVESDRGLSLRASAGSRECMVASATFT